MQEKTKSGGFTLIEIIVTLFIVSLILSIFLPRLPDIGGYRLRSSARRIANIIKYSRDRSAVEHGILRLNYNIDEGRYAIETLSGNEFQEYISSFRTKGKLPSGVIFKDIYTAGSGKKNEGTVATYFPGLGLVEDTLIHLSNALDSVYTIIVMPVTGKVIIEKGYKEIKKNER